MRDDSSYWLLRALNGLRSFKSGLTWDCGNATRIPNDLGQLLVADRWENGTISSVQVGSPAPKLIPPSSSNQLESKLKLVNEISSVPTVPAVPTSWDDVDKKALAEAAFYIALGAAHEYGPDWPPYLDDLSVRCINRLGGWIGFLDQLQDREISEIAKEFASLLNELVVHKSPEWSSYYMKDALPVLKGRFGERYSWRLRLCDLSLFFKRKIKKSDSIR